MNFQGHTAAFLGLVTKLIFTGDEVDIAIAHRAVTDILLVRQAKGFPLSGAPKGKLAGDLALLIPERLGTLVKGHV